jgi:ABC-type nitrate/sulfonate/bicarbonate transport system permease component
MNREASPFAARLVQLAFVAIAAGIWWEIGRTGAVSPLFVPPIDAVWRAFASLVRTHAFWSAVEVTLVTLAQAYAIAVALGIAIGWAVTRSRFLTEVFEPLVAGLFTIPITLFFPLFILFFGIGPGSKVAYGACYAVFPIALNTIAGLSNVEERYLRAARAMGFTPFGVFRHVLLPAAFPVIMSGLRIGFFICFASVLGGETISSVSGVGHAIALEAELMEPARMYAWIVFVVLTALALNALASAVENRRRVE